MKTKEEISRERLWKKHQNKMYRLRRKLRTIPLAKSYMLSSELLPEHGFEFTNEDISEERYRYYVRAIK